MRQHHNAIRNWHNIVNNSIPAESRIKTSIPIQQEEQPVIEEKVTEKLIQNNEFIIDSEDTVDTINKKK